MNSALLPQIMGNSLAKQATLGMARSSMRKLWRFLPGGEDVLDYSTKIVSTAFAPRD